MRRRPDAAAAECGGDAARRPRGEMTTAREVAATKLARDPPGDYSHGGARGCTESAPPIAFVRSTQLVNHPLGVDADEDARNPQDCCRTRAGMPARRHSFPTSISAGECAPPSMSWATSVSRCNVGRNFTPQARRTADWPSSTLAERRRRGSRRRDGRSAPRSRRRPTSGRSECAAGSRPGERPHQ